MQLRFKQVDVFTRVPMRGNPVAVVFGGEALSGEAMQRIAGWTNLSETTFVLPPSPAGATRRARAWRSDAMGALRSGSKAATSFSAAAR